MSMLTDKQVDQLNGILASTDNAAIERRARLLLSLNEGNSVKATAEEVGLARSTVQRWKRQFEADGMSIFPADVLEVPDAVDANPTGEMAPPEPEIEGVEPGEKPKKELKKLKKERSKVKKRLKDKDLGKKKRRKLSARLQEIKAVMKAIKSGVERGVRKGLESND